MVKIYVKNKLLIDGEMAEKGLNYKKLSILLGVSSGYLSSIVNRKKSVSSVLAKKMVDELELDFKDIFFIEETCKS